MSDNINIINRGLPITTRNDAGLFDGRGDPLNLSHVPLDRYVEGIPFDVVELPSSRIPTTGWQSLLATPLRTWTANQMIYLEQLFEVLSSLRAEDLTPEIRAQLLELPDRLEILTHDLKSPYFDNGTVSILGPERALNSRFGSPRLSVLRVNINMTDANTIDTSKSGPLGSAYKYVTAEWLQEKFGSVNVVSTSEGTGFLVSPVEEYQAGCSLSRFSREIKLKLMRPETIKEFGYDPKLLRIFKPRATAVFASVENTPAKGIPADDPEFVQTRTRAMLAGIEELFRELAVAAHLAEKEPSSVNLQGGLVLYNLDQMPRAGEPGYEVWREALQFGLGYVPANRYSPDSNDLFEIHPRPAHDFGIWDNQPVNGSEGGILQELIRSINEVATAETPLAINTALGHLRKAVDEASYVFQLGEMAELDPRNPTFFVKWKQIIRTHDGRTLVEYPFIEKLTKMKGNRVNLLFIELDSMKAKLLAREIIPNDPVASPLTVRDHLGREIYRQTVERAAGPNGMDDGDRAFWAPFEHFNTAASEMGIPLEYVHRKRPTLLMTKYAGDLVAIAVPAQDINGEPVDMKRFMERAQRLLREDPSNFFFQDLAKVDYPFGSGTRTVRLPIWQDPETGNFVASKERPEGHVPFMRQLTFTGVSRNIVVPREVADVQQVFYTAEIASDRIEVLKKSLAPYKAGMDVMSNNALRFEELEALNEPETLPQGEFKPEPMVTPIQQSGKYDGIESLLPVSIPGIGIWTGDGYILAPDFQEPLPPPEPMTTPAMPQLPTTFDMGSLVASSALEATAVSASAVSSMPAVPAFVRPAAAVNSIGNPLYMFLFDSAEYLAISIWFGGFISPLKFFDMKYNEPLDAAVRFHRQENCKANPTRECIDEFGPENLMI